MTLSASLKRGFAKAKDFPMGACMFVTVAHAEEALRKKFRPKPGEEEEEMRVVLFLKRYLTQVDVEFVLNGTNVSKLIEITGDVDVSEVIGTELVLYVEPTTMGPGLRLRAPRGNERALLEQDREGTLYAEAPHGQMAPPSPVQPVAPPPPVAPLPPSPELGDPGPGSGGQVPFQGDDSVGF